jgi:hypothetical protein
MNLTGCEIQILQMPGLSVTCVCREVAGATKSPRLQLIVMAILKRLAAAPLLLRFIRSTHRVVALRGPMHDLVCCTDNIETH